ncbi:hypothetical protein SODALDRAFT_317166 [Sodiomyces alkalinus F11]|uniref:MMS19 nucleotide excision repair protein n=1 Tax=Sodiomyces alkalinus (strain CBS 110278 / VKM F-3762 / F11) TaxID=1314773 RepID=A0A3N2PM39_SODAK|nr:hypothetical protein SODALDRAFT_317166 [Sodiomyces alkalinus F11]ROT35592.1 hypothetical protein SODALDRAFT_317166 [Sodiomyces alkalinus F11]
MTDFRTLALEYVLSDEPEKQKRSALNAASAIQSDPRPSNPVLRWVQSIGSWIAADEGSADVGEGGESTGDVIARSKALAFLADTIEALDSEFLNHDQVSHLISFFGSMFKIDHRHGIMPAARALSRVASMKAFKPTQADRIIQSVCGLGDDFKAQSPKTRAVVYDLISQIVSQPDAAGDLQHRYGASAGFMVDLLQLCRNERDPMCLLTWFGILRKFLTEYSPSPEVVTEIFNVFSAYFPISLRSSHHPSGITAEDLKVALRDCFSAHHSVAGQAFPFLIERLDQGEGLTATVKLDILRTLKACLQKCTDANQGVIPFADKIWTSLKYEVRNGEVEDAVKETLQVIGALFSRLDGDNLQRLVHTVQQDCLDDLDNPTYTPAAQKLLLAVSSGSPSAFALVAFAALQPVKDSLRHAKSTDHTVSLLNLLNSLQEVRCARMQQSTAALTPHHVGVLQRTEPAFVSLYRDVFSQPFQQAIHPEASKETLIIGEKAIQGLALLFKQQHSVTCSQIGDSILAPEDASEIISDLSSFLLSRAFRTKDEESEEALALLQAAIRALQAAVTRIPDAFSKLVTDSFAIFEGATNVSFEELWTRLRSMLPKLAFIGCSELPVSEDKLQHSVLLLSSLLRQLQSMINRKAPAGVWAEYAIGIHTTMYTFWVACENSLERPVREKKVEGYDTGLKDDLRFSPGRWVRYVSSRFSSLPTLQDESMVKTLEDENEGTSDSEPYYKKLLATESRQQLVGDMLLVYLFVARQLYRRATSIISSENATTIGIRLSEDFQGKDNEYSYAVLISRVAQFAISRLGFWEQNQLRLLEQVPALFRAEDVLVDGLGSEAESGGHQSLRDVMASKFTPELEIDWSNPPSFPINPLTNECLVLLAFGIMAPLQLTTIPVDPMSSGIITRLFFAGLLSRVDPTLPPQPLTSLMSLLMNVSNKIPLNELTNVLDSARAQIETAVSDAHSKMDLQQSELLAWHVSQRAGQSISEVRKLMARPVLYITAGALRRYKGNYLKAILAAIIRGPADLEAGHMFASDIEILFKESPVLQTDSHPRVVNPLWRQRAYMEIVKPMLDLALPKKDGSTSMTIAANYSIAVLHALRNLSLEIYEDDMEQIIRMIICVVRMLPLSLETLYGLQLVKTICQKGSDQVTPFLGSIIDICTSVLVPTEHERKRNRGAINLEALHAMTKDGGSKNSPLIPRIQVLALEILRDLTKHYEARHLRNEAPAVVRRLGRILGDSYRETRANAHSAISAWHNLIR